MQAAQNINTLEEWSSFRKGHFVGDNKPTKGTAIKKILSGQWPGRVDGDHVFIYVERFHQNLPAPSNIDGLVDELLR